MKSEDEFKFNVKVKVSKALSLIQPSHVLLVVLSQKVIYVPKWQKPRFSSYTAELPIKSTNIASHLE